MAKMRGIKPETWTDDKFVSLSPLARLLFIGMWNYACDNGHLDNSPRQLKMRILPADDCDAAALLEELVGQGVVERREGFLKVSNLPTHQRIDARYLTLCDHCAHDGESHFGEGDRRPRTSGTQSAPDVQPTGARAEGRKEGSEGESESTTGRKRPARTLPSDWMPTAKHQEHADKHSLDLSQEAFRFRNHALQVDRRCVNWNAAFTNWLSKAKPTPRQAAGDNYWSNW